MSTDTTERMDLELTMIVVDPELQPRESMDPGRIVQYAEDMMAGVEFPPIRVYRVSDRSGRYYLISGFHRYYGAEQAGLETIACEVIEGTFAEARWDAAGSNLEWDLVGARRTNADKRRAVRMALEAMPKASNRKIAQQVGVDQSWAGRLIKEWSDHGGVKHHHGNGTSGSNGTAQTNASHFVCGTCGEPFDVEVWHCPGCDHHWAAGEGSCGNCHRFRRTEDGSTVAIDVYDGDDEDPGGGDDAQQNESAPFSLEVLPSSIAAEVRPAARFTFNQTNEMVDWARWTWNPVTGCEHNCIYCYARDIANRFYAEKFVPTYRPERLDAPRATRLPGIAESASDPVERTSWRNVFVCSMADLFGRWVPDEWIEGVFRSCRQSPEWNYLFLTKFPQRYVGLDFPATAWVGTSVDEQKRVPNAEKAFRKIESPVKWLSVEPMQEAIEFTDMKMFDWVVIGGRSRSSGAPEFHPEPAWVARLIDRALTAGCAVYCKPNTDPDSHWTGLFKQYPRTFTESAQ